MADDIVTRLRVIHCAADDLTPCGTCLPCQAADEIERLRALVDDYENGINWHTNCTNCAKLLDDNYDQYCEIERLRAREQDLRMHAEQDACEIERLRADLAAEQALADQLAHALRWQADPFQKGTLMMSHDALDAYEEARRG